MEENAKTMQYVFNEDLFRSRLREAINEKNYKNAQLSRITGVSAATIGHYLGTGKNTRKPRGVADIYPIAKALGVSLDYLFGLSDEKVIGGVRNDGSSEPKNYYDAVRMINTLTLAFLAKSDLTVSMGDSVQIVLNDPNLAEYMRQQKQLFDMHGISLSDRAFVIALDDLNDKMKGHPIPEEYSLPF